MHPSKQRPKLSVKLSGSRYPKLYFYIPNNKLVCFGLIAVGSVSLKDIARDGASIITVQFQFVPSKILYTSSNLLTVGIININTIVPVHVLIIPQRVLSLLSDLAEEVYQDIWSLARTIQGMLQP